MTAAATSFIDPDFGGIGQTNRLALPRARMTVELADALASGDRRQIGMARERAGLSQGALARLLGVSTRTVWGWESGERVPLQWRREEWAAEAERLRAVGGGR